MGLSAAGRVVRQARAGDCARIAEIWNPVIADSARTFTTAQRSVAELRQMLDEKAEAGLPFLVAEKRGVVEGFATYGQFRAGSGYARTMEHTIILDPEARGQGVGRALMAGLEQRARAVGVHSLWAGVSGENPDGVAFHAALGFETVAVLPEVGWKFGRWMDLILMRKIL